MELEIEKDMTPILLEDLGTRYPTENSKHRRRYGLYKCQYCDKEFETTVQSVKCGDTKSCGCQSQGHRNPHGLRGHILYGTWKMMKIRCNNSNHMSYKYYGGRGIQVCERWLDIKNFVEDMYPSWEEGLTLDRIDVDGNYEPDNCRWVDLNTQSRNTRNTRVNNTSGYRGVSWDSGRDKWVAKIRVNYTRIHLGYYQTSLEAAKAYERYVRLNNLEHNFTPALTEDELKEINKKKEEIK